jgi:hypothetical protein
MTDRDDATPDERSLLELDRRAGERSGSREGDDQSTTASTSSVEVDLQRILRRDYE